MQCFRKAGSRRISPKENPFSPSDLAFLIIYSFFSIPLPASMFYILSVILPCSYPFFHFSPLTFFSSSLSYPPIFTLQNLYLPFSPFLQFLFLSVCPPPSLCHLQLPRTAERQTSECVPQVNQAGERTCVAACAHRHAPTTCSPARTLNPPPSSFL